MINYVLPDEQLAALIQDLSFRGCGIAGLIRILNEKRIKPHCGRAWDYQNVKTYMDVKGLAFDPRLTMNGILEEIERLKQNGLSHETIADVLNGAGYLTTRGAEFTRKAVTAYWGNHGRIYRAEKIVTELLGQGADWQTITDYLNFRGLKDSDYHPWEMDRVKELADEAGLLNGNYKPEHEPDKFYPVSNHGTLQDPSKIPLGAEGVIFI